MRSVIYAATRCGYGVQVIDGGEVIYEYAAGNHQKESLAVVDPRSSNAVNLRRLKTLGQTNGGPNRGGAGDFSKRGRI
jgi:hypothetical protein